MYALGALAAASIGILIWTFTSPLPQVSDTAAASSAPAQSATPVQPVTPVEPATASRSEASRVDLQASEMTWVSLAQPDGTKILSQLFQPGEVRSVDLPKSATLRVGNAAGLNVRFNGNPIGSIGPHGAVREVRFNDGAYKIVPVQ
jgi:cytoskeleton protein RodZ